jgi:hypothetical protein
MFSEDPYFYDILRKSEVLFATMFNHTYIEREDANNVVVKSMIIPFLRGPKDKVLARVDDDPSLQREVAIVLPLMSYEMVGMHKDSSRQLFPLNKTVALDPADKNRMYRQFGAVPYDFEFELYIYVKEERDGNKILEQIVPYFQPDWTPSVHLVPELGHVVDIPIILNSIQKEDSYTGNFETRRALIWTLSFTMKTYLYGPTKSKPIIKFANTNILVGTPSDNGGAQLTFRVYPGLDANGNPTQTANNSIGANNISATDNYGYIIE